MTSTRQLSTQSLCIGALLLCTALFQACAQTPSPRVTVIDEEKAQASEPSEDRVVKALESEFEPSVAPQSAPSEEHETQMVAEDSGDMEEAMGPDAGPDESGVLKVASNTWLALLLLMNFVFFFV